MLSSPQQAEIIQSPLESQCILAGPGSGKTYVLTQRIISLLERNLIRGTHCLALTFGVSASLELRNRIHGALGRATSSMVTVKTIHALCLSILKKHDPSYVFRELCQNKEQIESIVDSSIAPFYTMPAFPKEATDPEKALWIAHQCLRCQPQELMHPNSCSWEIIITKAIMHGFAQQNLFLFDFLCFDACVLLKKENIFLPYTAVFVDEFQDLTPTQFAFIACLTPPASSFLTIVGDPNQSIYGWRGSSPELFERACTHHPNMKTYHLSQTFRCPQNIMATANILIANNPNPSATHVQTEIPAGIVSIHRYSSIQEELSKTASRISTWLDQEIPPSSIAVFARTSELVQQSMLFFHNNGLPIQGENPLAQKEGKQMLSLLNFLHDGSQLENAINIGRRRVRSTTYRQLIARDSTSSLEKQLRDLCTSHPAHYPEVEEFLAGIDAFSYNTDNLVESLSLLFKMLKFPTEHSDIPAQDNVLAVAALTLNIAQSAPSLPYIIDTLTDFKSHSFEDRNSILVTTLHKSKGLEFSHVCILGNQNNIFPHVGLTKNDAVALAEERRLLYVGITRSKQELHLSNHSAPQNNSFSQRDGFLHELAPYIG